jgi:lipopolysaccharide transport system permease protein
MLGSVVWSYFAFCFTQTSRTLVAGAREFGSAPFPRLTVPLATVFSGLIQFMLQFTLFFILYIVYLRGVPSFSLKIIFVPSALLQLALLGMGGGILVSALTSRYRDLSYLIGFCVQLLYFCTPVVYPLSMVKEPWRWWYRFNPMTSVVEVFRMGFFSAGSLTSVEYLAGWLVTALILCLGLVVFNAIEKKAIDTI